MKGKRNLSLVITVTLLFVLLVGTVYAAGGKERFKWIVSDRATFLEGGVEFYSDVSFGDGVLKLDDGTAAAPGLSWVDDTNSGWYRAAADNIGLSLGGAGIVLYNDWGADTITADTTEYLVEILDSTPVMTGGTNSLAAVNIDMGIGNSTGGTNSVYGLLIDTIVQDAQNTETAIAIGNGWDRGLDMDGNSIYLDNDQDTIIAEASDDKISFTPGAASGGLNVLTGNFWVGNGTPDSTPNGEDAYIEGGLEVDGQTRLDGNAYVPDDGILAFGASNDGYFWYDETTDDELKLTIASASGGLEVQVGNVWIGNGSPDETINGEDLYVEGISEFDGAANMDSTLDVAGTATFSAGSGDAAVIAAGGVLSLPATADVSAYGYVAVGDGTPDGAVTAGNDEELYVEGELEVDGTAEFDGAANFDGAVDMDSTLDVAGTATFSAGSGDAAIIAAGGVLSLPATADVSAYGYVAIGDGTPDGAVTAGNDEELYVEGELEVDGTAEFDGAVNIDGAVDMDSTIDVAGAATMGSDVTISAVTDGGNQGAKNELSGLPRIKLVGLAQGTNPGGETVDCMDSTPTGEWVEIDAGTNLTVTADTNYYRYDTNSVKMDVATVAENDGISVTLPAQDDLSGLESIGFWMYSDEAISSGDLDLTIDDSDGVDQTYSIGAVSANVWTWVEVDISACDANCDTADYFLIEFTAQGAGALSDPAIYFDELYYWDSVDEDALSTAILRDGVLSVVDTEGGTTLVEYTDYIVHEESGNDFVVWITDQSAADVVALVAY